MVLKALLSLSYLGLKLKLSYLQTLKTISNQISFVECAYKLFYLLPSFFFYLSPFGILLPIFSLKFDKLLKVIKRQIPPSYPSQKPAHVLTLFDGTQENFSCHLPGHSHARGVLAFPPTRSERAPPLTFPSLSSDPHLRSLPANPNLSPLLRRHKGVPTVPLFFFLSISS
jgi:hypothetical protein